MRKPLHIKASEVKVLKTYNEENFKLALINHEGNGYIGWEVNSYLNEDYDFVDYDEPHFEVIDDDASHLHLDEFEGIFEMRCDDFVMEMASLRAGF